jgi:hypothetical protein
MCKLVQQLLNNWHWILRLGCEHVELSEINTKSEGAILLLNEEYCPEPILGYPKKMS